MSKNTDWTPEKSHTEIWRILKELAASQKKTDAELKELVAERKKSSAEIEVTMKDLAAAQSRTDARLGGIGQNLGGLAEDFFYYNAPAALKEHGFRIDSYDRNIINDKISKAGKFIPPSREYDIIGVNGDYVVVIEVKSMLKKKHINKFVKLLPHFVKDFPEHKGKKVYGGIAGMSLDEGRGKEKERIKKTVEEKGLFLLTQSNSEAAEIHKPGKGLTSLKNFGQGA